MASIRTGLSFLSVSQPRININQLKKLECAKAARSLLLACLLPRSCCVGARRKCEHQLVLSVLQPGGDGEDDRQQHRQHQLMPGGDGEDDIDSLDDFGPKYGN